MSRRGSYIGGHTVIGPGSNWFSKKKPVTLEQKAKQERAKERERAALELRREENKKKRERAEREREAARARKAAKIAARNTPEARAERALQAAAKRAEQEAKMAKITVVRLPSKSKLDTS